MDSQLTRRTLLGAAVGAASAAFAAPSRLPIKKGMLWGMLPKDLSPLEKFELAKECGFEEMECQTTEDPAQVEAILAASRKTGMRIHSVMNMEHWRSPLSSPNREVVEKSLKGMETSLRNAKAWGADTVLLVPAVVNAEVGYQQAWERSQREIRKLLPLAKELNVIIGIEDVWNKFLLSPTEMGRYVDEFNSPFVKVYFDVGNILFYGFPQDWIRTLGKRIVKVHLKDFKFEKRMATFVNLREGQIDWKAVHAALRDTGYRGTATVEVDGGDKAYFQDLSRRVDLILNGE